MGCTPSGVPVAASFTTVKGTSRIKPSPKICDDEKLEKISAADTKFSGVFVGCLLIRFASYSCHLFLLPFLLHCS